MKFFNCKKRLTKIFFSYNFYALKDPIDDLNHLNIKYEKDLPRSLILGLFQKSSRNPNLYPKMIFDKKGKNASAAKKIVIMQKCKKTAKNPFFSLENMG